MCKHFKATILNYGYGKMQSDCNYEYYDRILNNETVVYD